MLFHNDGGSLNTYREMVEDLDNSIGAVIAALRRSGQLDNTLVFFASDNGGERFSNTWPLSGGKGQLTEGGIRVPTILSWPDRLGPRRVHNSPVSTVDWTTTFLDIAGVKPRDRYPLDGASLSAHLLRGAPFPRHDLFWRMKGQRALRRGDLKYVRLADGADRLYNLADDVRGQANLAKKRPADLAALRAAWEAVDVTLVPYPS